ncbi:MAG TPA: hypothetical protein VNV86_08775 [Candidatus Acidoferrum sp.]|nr:hypothetical protein [Candidatus Acidoferrum sp.]
MVTMASPTTSRGGSISPSWRPRNCPFCARTLAGEAGINLRLLSSGEGKYDLGSEDREGNQDSTISVFTRDADGTMRHFYTAHPRMVSHIRNAASTF